MSLCGDNVQGARDFEALSPKWDVFLKPCPLKVQGSIAKRKLKIIRFTGNSVSKEIVSSRHIKTDAHMNAETVTALTRSAQVQTRLSRRSGHKVPPLMKPFARNACWKEKISFLQWGVTV